MLKPGKPLKQRPQYVVETEIGEGGFSVTYKAKHQELNFPLLLKLLMVVCVEMLIILDLWKVSARKEEH
jgi:hypothetical protein